MICPSYSTLNNLMVFSDSEVLICSTGHAGYRECCGCSPSLSLRKLLSPREEKGRGDINITTTKQCQMERSNDGCCDHFLLGNGIAGGWWCGIPSRVQSDRGKKGPPLSIGVEARANGWGGWMEIEAISRSLFALIVATQTATLTIPMKPSPSLADCPLICNSMNPAHACHQGRQCVYSIHFPPPHCVSVRRFKCKFKFSFASTRVQVLERD